MSFKKILILPDLSKDKGGPTTFFNFFKKNLSNLNISFCHNFEKNISHGFVINGTRKFHLLLLLFFTGKPITLRLGSIYRSNIFEKPGLLGKINFLPKYISVNFSILLAKNIIFQSQAVKEQWSFHPFIKRKQYSIIYNPSLYKSLNNEYLKNLKSSKKITKNEIKKQNINLITIEGNHPSPYLSLPFQVYSYLKLKFYSVKLYVFGETKKEWEEVFAKEEAIFKMGYLRANNLANEIKKINMPIYIPADNLTMGCPNSLILSQSLSIPAVTLEKTPATELINLSAGGLSVLIENFNIKSSITKKSNLEKISKQIFKLIKNYQKYALNANTLDLVLSEKKVFTKYISAIGLINPANSKE